MAEIKHFEGEGDSAVRPDKKMTQRNVVVVVMKHPTEDLWLCMRKKKFDWIDFVMGGIEGEETPEEAGARELTEETGFTDFEIIGTLPDVYYDRFYAAHKDVNREITVHTVYGQLKSLKAQDRDPEEIAEGEVRWTSSEDLPKVLHTDAHRWDWERVSALPFAA